MYAFEYHRPTTVAEAASLLAGAQPTASCSPAATR